MQYTPNYDLPLYEPSDIANYLETYNNTITEIDNAIHEVQLKAEYGGTQDAEMQKEIESLNARVTALESSLETTIENVNSMSTTVSGHTAEIAKLKEDLLAQNTAVKTLSNNLADLGTRFTSFAAGQEHFNNEISARVGNRFFKTYKYSIGSSTSKEQYTADFTVETGLANDENFTKSHVMLDFMQVMADEKKASAVLNSGFTTTERVYNYTVNGIRYNVRINFNSSTGSIGIRITGQKQEAAGLLFANAIVYTD